MSAIDLAVAAAAAETRRRAGLAVISAVRYPTRSGLVGPTYTAALYNTATTWREVVAASAAETRPILVLNAYFTQSMSGAVSPVWQIGAGAAGAETLIGQIPTVGSDSHFMTPSAPTIVPAGQRVAIRCSVNGTGGSNTFWVNYAYLNTNGVSA